MRGSPVHAIIVSGPNRDTRKDDTLTNSPRISEVPPLTCPSCETDQLRPLSQASARCASCGCLLNGTALQTLRQIVMLPDVVGGHACECGHPEMRLLPDGVFRCPCCHAEVLPITLAEVSPGTEHHGKAYWSGWLEGRFGDSARFTESESLKQWEELSDRLAYYQGHRAGSRDRRPRRNTAPQAA